VDWQSHEDREYIDIDGIPRYNITLMEKFTRQWAQFIYNLTSGPIPEQECTAKDWIPIPWSRFEKIALLTLD